MNAWALTEHGNANSFAHAYLYNQKLKSKGIDFKFIPGAELYVHPDLDVWQYDYQISRAAKSGDKDAVAKLRAEREKIATHIDVVTDSDDEITDIQVSSDEASLTVENEEETKSGKFFDPVKRRHHLVVLPKTSIGLQRLFSLISRGYMEGFYRFPRIDFDMLKQHNEGLIISTACVGGYPASLAIRGEATGKSFNQIQLDLENMTDRFVDAVGRDNFNLEIQFNGLSVQHTLNKHLMALSDSTGIPLVATADSHYYSRDMWEARELYKKLGRMGARGDKMPALPTFDELKCELYPKNAAQMWDEYMLHKDSYEFYKNADQKVCDAIERTYDIAWDQCEEIWFDKIQELKFCF